MVRYLRFLFLISVPGLIIGLLAIEGLLRLVGYTPYYLTSDAFVPSQNAQVSYELRPGFSGLYAGVPISVNLQGFRGRDPSNQNETPMYRVVVVGDSIAFGQGVGERETLSDQLAVQLQRKIDSPVEVVNLGVPGEVQRWTEDISKLKSLGYELRLALVDGLKDTTDWFLREMDLLAIS